MAYLDYSPVELPDYSEGIRRFGDALTDLMKRREQRRQFEETQKFQREQEERKFKQAEMNIDYQNRIIDERAKRDELRFNFEQDERAAAAADRARKAASPQEAEAIVGAIRRYDPKTGQEVGRGKLEAGPLPEVGPEPVAPTAPAMPPEIAARFRGRRGGQMPSPEEGAMVGPIPTAEIAKSAEIRRIAEEPATEQVPDVEARLAAVERERANQEAQRADYLRKFESYSEEFPAPVIGPTAADAAYAQAQQGFQADQAAFPGRQAAHAAEVRSAEARRPYTMSFGPGQPTTTFDFETQRTAARQQAANDFLQTVGQLPLSPEDKQAAQVGHALILSGQDPQKVMSQFNSERTLGIKQRFAGEQGDLNRENRLEVAKVPRPGLTLQTQRFDFDQQKLRSGNLRKDLESFVKRYDAKTIQDDNLAAPRIINDLKSGNAQRQRNAMIELWRMAQHDNRMSDKDAVMAQTVDPGLLATIENEVSRKATGVLSDDVRETAIATAQGFASALAGKTQQMRTLAKRDFIDSGEYDQHEADVLLGQQLPGWTRLMSDQQKLRGGGPPEVGARRKGKAAAEKTKVKAPTVEEALRLLEAAP